MEGIGGEGGVKATFDGVQEGEHLFSANEDCDVYCELDGAIGL